MSQVKREVPERETMMDCPPGLVGLGDNPPLTRETLVGKDDDNGGTKAETRPSSEG